MKKTALLLLFLPAAAAAGNPEAGKAKSQPCAACHGPAGNTPTDANPKIAGQSRKYLLHVMRQYQNGQRQDPVMNAQLGKNSGFTDQDLRDLAAFYAAQPGDLR